MNWKEFIDWLISLIKPKPKPVPVPPTPTPVPSVKDLDKLLKLHNDQRVSLGVHTLASNVMLNRAAQQHSDWMLANKTLSHTGYLGSSPGGRILGAGYDYSTFGENIANGYPTAEKVFKGWLASSGHRANIENSNFRDIGLGVSGTYWTVVFGAIAQATEGISYDG